MIETSRKALARKAENGYGADHEKKTCLTLFATVRSWTTPVIIGGTINRLPQTGNPSACCFLTINTIDPAY